MDRGTCLVFANFNPVTFVQRSKEHANPFGDALTDRFLFKLQMGYPSAEAELAMISSKTDPHLVRVDPDLIQRSADDAAKMRLSEALGRRVIHVVHRTRTDEALILGASPRASTSIVRAAAASAVLDGRSGPEQADLDRLWLPLLTHRLWMTPEAVQAGLLVRDIIARCTAQ
jgi:MoxR-like ATPase